MENERYTETPRYQDVTFAGFGEDDWDPQAAIGRAVMDHRRSPEGHLEAVEPTCRRGRFG